MQLTIRISPSATRTQSTVTAIDSESIPPRTLLIDVLNIDSVSHRRRFATQVASDNSSISAPEVEAALLDAASRMEFRNASLEQDREAPDDPHRLARVCLNSWSDSERRLKLIYFRDEFSEFNGVYYQPVSMKDIRATVTTAIKQEFDRFGAAGILAPNSRLFKVTTRLINDVLMVIESLAKVSDARMVPMWRDPRPGRITAPENVLVTPSGLVDLSAYIAGNFLLLPPTPDFISFRGIDFSVDPYAQCPTWENFLRQLWPDDPESIQTLAKWFGYLLTTDTSQQKLLMLCGPTRSGKGTIGRVLTRLLGESNVVGPTLRRMQGEFGIEPLINKPLAIVSDARLSGKIDAMSLLEELLSITGEDTMTVNRKNKPMATLRLPTRIMISCNEFPRFQDASQAIFSRLLLLQLRHSWLDSEDPTLTERLYDELPGILNWAIAGLGQLRQQGRFQQPASSREFLEDCRRLVSPIHAFIEDRLDVGLGVRVSTQACYQEWMRWRAENGVQVLNELSAFGRSLRAALPALSISQPTEGGVRRREYVGIRIRTMNPDGGGSAFSGSR